MGFKLRLILVLNKVTPTIAKAFNFFRIFFCSTLINSLEPQKNITSSYMKRPSVLLTSLLKKHTLLSNYQM